jgi:predicted Zn-dependent peptidase
VIEISELAGGMRLVTETMPVRSACLGFWVGTGSRDEGEGQEGISHFLEHLLFKGTPHRGAREIAEAIDAVGGDMNAYTTKEYTAFYVRLLAEDLELGMEVLGDIMLEPALRSEEVDAERQVILEEVLMHLDEPADVVQERFSEALFPGHPLGREVLGLPEVITGLSVQRIRDFFEEHYRPANIVIAAAGDVDHAHLAAELGRRFGDSPSGQVPVRRAPAAELQRLDVTTRDCEQAQIVLGVRTPARRSPQRYALSLLNHSLGGGLSSRLFQKVREERGLCYSISSDRIAYSDAGLLAVSVGTGPEHVDEVLEIVVGELDDLARNGVTQRELDLAKGHVKAEMLLSLEDSGSRMHRLGASLLLHGEVLGAEEIARRIDGVGREDVAAVAAEILDSTRVLAAVGPFEASDFADFAASPAPAARPSD